MLDCRNALLEKMVAMRNNNSASNNSGGRTGQGQGPRWAAEAAATGRALQDTAERPASSGRSVELTVREGMALDLCCTQSYTP